MSCFLRGLVTVENVIDSFNRIFIMIVQKWYERIINSKDQFFIDDKFDSIYNKRNIVKEGI